MAYDYQQVCQRLKEKAQLIAQRYQLALEQRNEARAETLSLENELKKRDAEIRQLKTQIENLTVVRTAFPSKQAVADSRSYLTGLVREIDQCIKDLTT